MGLPIIYSRIHKKEKIHKIFDYLNLDELIFPEEVSKWFDTDNYKPYLIDFYKKQGDIIILEPHSTVVDYKVDYILYYSNINKDILKGFVEVAGEGIIRSTNDEVKRILIEVLFKPEENIEFKIKMLSKAFKNIIKTQE